MMPRELLGDLPYRYARSFSRNADHSCRSRIFLPALCSTHHVGALRLVSRRFAAPVIPCELSTACLLGCKGRAVMLRGFLDKRHECIRPVIVNLLNLTRLRVLLIRAQLTKKVDAPRRD